MWTWTWMRMRMRILSFLYPFLHPLRKTGFLVMLRKQMKKVDVNQMPEVTGSRGSHPTTRRRPSEARSLIAKATTKGRTEGVSAVAKTLAAARSTYPYTRSENPFPKYINITYLLRKANNHTASARLTRPSAGQ